MNLFLAYVFILYNAIIIIDALPLHRYSNNKLMAIKKARYSSELYISHNNNHGIESNKFIRFFVSSILSISIVCETTGIATSPVFAKTELPSLDRLFTAVEKELDPVNGESLLRIKSDIDSANWEDLKVFTREYDAGFRGGILKSIWKQLEDESKKKGIELSNSFTFDLIALNKAARIGDKQEALNRLEQVRSDLKGFLDFKK